MAEARRQLEAEPARLGYGDRLAAALLAVELKDFAAANTLFDAALKADKAKPAEALIAWGLDLLSAAQSVAEAAKVFQRGLSEKSLPADNPPFYFYLAGALGCRAAPTRRSTPPAPPAELQKDSPASPAAPPGSNITPSATRRPGKATPS